MFCGHCRYCESVESPLSKLGLGTESPLLVDIFVLPLVVPLSVLTLQALSIYMWLSNLLLVKLCAEATTTAAEQTTTVAEATTTVVASVGGAKAEWRG